MHGSNEDDFKRINAFSLYDYMATPYHKDLSVISDQNERPIRVVTVAVLL